MNADLFDFFLSGGNGSLPYLLDITAWDKEKNKFSCHYANNNEAIEHKGETYLPCSFEYSRNDGLEDSAELRMSVRDIGGTEIPALKNLMDMDVVELSVTGIMASRDSVTPIDTRNHKFSTVKLGNDGTLVFTLKSDDRFSMIMNPYKFDTINNPGNA